MFASLLSFWIVNESSKIAPTGRCFLMLSSNSYSVKPVIFDLVVFNLSHKI